MSKVITQDNEQVIQIYNRLKGGCKLNCVSKE